MDKMIFVNLPVADLGKATAFYQAIGFDRHPQFSNDQASGMVWSDTIMVMLLTHAFWRTFTDREIPDARRTCQVLLAISREDRAAVDAIVDAAAAAGGKADPNPRQDHGFMYGRSFEDPDGHIWEPSWMDPEVASGAVTPAGSEA